MERQYRNFQSIEDVPPILQSVFYVDLPNDGYQIVHGVNERNIDKICSGEPYLLKNEPWAVQFPAYRLRTLETYPYLTPYQPISPNEADRLGIELIFMANRSLIPNAMMLKGSDFGYIGELGFPGKSAHIDFTGITRTQPKSNDRKNAIDFFYQTIAKKDTDRSDALHVTTVDQLNSNGFITYFAPIKNYPLHLRICDLNIIQKFINNDYINDDDKKKSAERLCKLWEAYY